MFRFLVIVLLAFGPSFAALADFDYKGAGKLRYPTGMEKDFEFGFAFKQNENGYYFKVGKQEMSTNDVPKKYTIWLTLHKGKHVFVQEFAKGYFEGFNWNIGEHNIELKKKVLSKKRAKADYVLMLNGEELYFRKTTGQIEIQFTKKGISKITSVGFVRDIAYSTFEG